MIGVLMLLSVPSMVMAASATSASSKQWRAYDAHNTRQAQIKMCQNFQTTLLQGIKDGSTGQSAIQVALAKRQDLYEKIKKDFPADAAIIQQQIIAIKQARDQRLLQDSWREHARALPFTNTDEPVKAWYGTSHADRCHEAIADAERLMQEEKNRAAQLTADKQVLLIDVSQQVTAYGLDQYTKVLQQLLGRGLTSEERNLLSPLRTQIIRTPYAIMAQRRAIQERQAAIAAAATAATVVPQIDPKAEASAVVTTVAPSVSLASAAADAIAVNAISSSVSSSVIAPIAPAPEISATVSAVAMPASNAAASAAARSWTSTLTFGLVTYWD